MPTNSNKKGSIYLFITTPDLETLEKNIENFDEDFTYWGRWRKYSARAGILVIAALIFTFFATVPSFIDASIPDKESLLGRTNPWHALSIAIIVFVSAILVEKRKVDWSILKYISVMLLYIGLALGFIIAMSYLPWWDGTSIQDGMSKYFDTEYTSTWLFVLFIALFIVISLGEDNLTSIAATLLNHDSAIADRIVKMMGAKIGVVVSNDGHFLLDNKYSETIKSLKDCNDLFHLTDEYEFEDKNIRFVLHELLSKMNIPFWEKAQEKVKQKIEEKHPKLKEKGFKYATELPCITPSEIFQCWTGDRNQLKLASQIYESVLGAESSENQNVQICTRESIELLEHLCMCNDDAQSVEKLSKKDNNKLVLEKGFTAGLDKLISLPEKKFKLTTLECENIIEAIVVLRKYEIYWFWYELNSNNPPLMDNLESAFAKVNITLSIKDVIAIQEMKFALDQFNVEFLQKHLISYVDTYLYKSLSIRASQRKALEELKKEMEKAEKQKAEKEVETEIKRLKGGYDEEMATMFCDGILVFKTKKTMENNVDTIHAYSSILWVFTRIKNKEVFERVHKEAKKLLGEFTEVLRNIPIDDIPANELWHYHNIFANYYERLVEFGIEIEKNTEKALESYLYALKVNGADRKWISGSFSNIADFLYCYVYKKEGQLSAKCCQLLVNLVGEDETDFKKIIEKYSLKSIKMKLEIFDISDISFPADIYSKVAK
jgi:hypothetical protein